MPGGIMIEFGPSKGGKGLASEIASKMPPPGKLRKQAAMDDDDGEDTASAVKVAAGEAFADAVKQGDGKAIIKAFQLMDRLCDGGDESEYEDDEDADEE